MTSMGVAGGLKSKLGEGEGKSEGLGTAQIEAFLLPLSPS
ncbi:hypothetical protein E2C01_081489 [Portunus trituberculatus]|uniref:Uncharacterized protein n=1 Tax=Portunus trituberculatus TaxID=210409 RepID=A0A5B7IWH5_PORTR|nr:hypothetical protein [Portunus trituberculatus]